MKERAWVLGVIVAILLAFFLGAMTQRNNPKSVAESDNPAVMQDVFINPNTADKEALIALPGVGPVLADRIIRERTENGFFASKSDLLRVRGIGPKKLKKILPYIVITHRTSDHGEELEGASHGK